MDTLLAVTFPRVPLTRNREKRMHWSAVGRDVKAWYLVVRHLARYGPWMKRPVWVGKRVQWTDDESTWTRPREPVLVEITVHRKGRTQDVDNAPGSCKNLLDALVRLGWLVDDSQRWAELKVIEVVDNREPKTVVRIYSKGGDSHGQEEGEGRKGLLIDTYA